jgi:hypothetical protein
MAAFEPVTDKAELQRLLDQLIAECEQEVEGDEQRAASASATEAAGKNATGWRAFQNERAPAQPVPTGGGKSLFNLRVQGDDKKKK